MRGAQRGEEPCSQPVDLRLPKLGAATHPQRLIGRRQPGLGLAGARVRLEQDAHQQGVEAGGRGRLATGGEDDAAESLGSPARPVAEDPKEGGVEVGDDPDLGAP